MNIKLSLAIVLSCGAVASNLLAQNELRPGRLPENPAKPIESATDAAAEDEPNTGGVTSPARPKGKPQPATAKTAVDNAKEARLLLHEAAQISQVAKTVEQCSEIIELCKRASEMKLAAEEAKYARNLQSWAYNRRGEANAAQAVEFLNQGSETEAANLDRQALADFQAAVKLDPNRWKAIHNRAVSYGVLGMHEDAAADFTRVIQLKPDYVNAWFNRAEIYLESGRTAEAIRDYSEALKLKPDDAAARRQRGRAYARNGKTSQALADFSKAIEINASDAVSLVERGELHAGQGAWEKARADFHAAIETDPDCAEAYCEAAWLMATCPQTKYRNGKTALEFAEQAMELAQAQKKHDFTYYDVLAAALANAGRFDEAQRALQKAIPHAPLAHAAAMKKRFSLYAAARPYREEAATAAKPANTKVQR